MKYIILSLICFLSVTFCNAQRVTYNDLIYVLNHNIAISEDYLSNKGFEFSGVDTLTGKLVTFNYSFTKNSKYDKTYISVDKKSSKEIFYEVSVYTLLQSDYLPIKALIKKLGYKLLNTEVREGNLINTYKKDFLEIRFMLTSNQKLDYTQYYITITDTNKQLKAWNLSE